MKKLVVLMVGIVASCEVLAASSPPPQAVVASSQRGVSKYVVGITSAVSCTGREKSLSTAWCTTSGSNVSLTIKSCPAGAGCTKVTPISIQAAGTNSSIVYYITDHGGTYASGISEVIGTYVVTTMYPQAYQKGCIPFLSCKQQYTYSVKKSGGCTQVGESSLYACPYTVSWVQNF